MQCKRLRNRGKATLFVRFALVPNHQPDQGRRWRIAASLDRRGGSFISPLFFLPPTLPFGPSVCSAEEGPSRCNYPGQAVSLKCLMFVCYRGPGQSACDLASGSRWGAKPVARKPGVDCLSGKYQRSGMPTFWLSSWDLLNRPIRLCLETQSR